MIDEILSDLCRCGLLLSVESQSNPSPRLKTAQAHLVKSCIVVAEEVAEKSEGDPLLDFLVRQLREVELKIGEVI